MKFPDLKNIGNQIAFVITMLNAPQAKGNTSAGSAWPEGLPVATSGPKSSKPMAFIFKLDLV